MYPLLKGWTQNVICKSLGAEFGKGEAWSVCLDILDIMSR